jgi:hypothetical protein
MSIIIVGVGDADFEGKMFVKFYDFFLRVYLLN